MNATTRTRIRTVAGVLAVTVACSTGAYAAGAAITSSSQIKAGVVNTGDIKNGTVKVKDLNKKTRGRGRAEATRPGTYFNAPGNPSAQSAPGSGPRRRLPGAPASARTPTASSPCAAA